MSTPGRIKAFVGRSLDVLGWFALRSTRIRFHHWNTLEVTNKGDIAIRESVKEQLVDVFAPRPVAFTEIGWGMLDPAAAGKIGREHDLFVIAGSGYIFSHDGGELHPRSALDRAFLQNIMCPRVAYGIGWNKLLSSGNLREERPLTQDSHKILKGILGRLDLVSVRDGATHDLVEELTSNSPAIPGDPALFYHGVGFSPAKSRDGKLRVGLNFAMHGHTSSKRISLQHAQFCEFLRAFARRHDVTYHYVQHTHTERALPLMLRSRGIQVETIDLPPDQLPAFYASLDLHVCQMLHSAILAVGAAVPTLHFAYDVKSIGFFELMQMPEHCFPSLAFNQQQALSALEALHANAAEISAHIKRRKDELRAVRDAFCNEIKALVEN